MFFQDCYKLTTQALGAYPKSDTQSDLLSLVNIRLGRKNLSGTYTLAYFCVKACNEKITKTQMSNDNIEKLLLFIANIWLNLEKIRLYL